MPSITASVRRAALAALAVVALVAGIVTVPAVTAVLPVAPAAAAGDPDIQLTRTVAAQSLYGPGVQVTLTAASPHSSPEVDAYNLTFSDVLPVGATVASSTYPVSRLIPQLDGTTLVIWENVADLLDDTSVSIGYTFSYPVLGDTDPYDVGDQFSGTAHAYVSTDPFLIPNPMDTPADGSVWEDYTGWAQASSSTELVPFIVSKSEPTREDELLRGIHDNKTVYTITVTNNTVRPTTGPVVTDYLPAVLEFLGCTAADNSSAPEYPGAPGLDASFPAVTDCDPDYTADTVSLDPDGAGPMPSAVYTRVVWDQLPDLAASGVVTLRYAAGIPLRANVLDPAVTNPVANLDNNTGPEADDEQAIVNYVAVSGDYQGGAPTPATFVVGATATVTAEDVRIWKSASDPAINQGQTTTWTLDIATSEYTRSTDDIVVTDTIPDGLDWAGSPTPLSAGPTQNPDGTLTVQWTLAGLGMQDTAQITFQTVTRTDYRAVSGEPVSANDSWTNHVGLTTSTTLRSGADGDGTRTVADVVDESEAGQAAEDVRLDKTIGVPIAGDCTAVTTWTDASAAPLHPGDVVCYRLDVMFPGLLDTQRARISDFLPPGFALVGNPYYNTPTHDLGDSDDLSFQVNPARTVMTWTKEAVDRGQHFSVILTVQIATTAAMQKTDLAANLLKVRTQNSAGDAFQLRDQADADITAPLLTLDKALVSPASGTVEAGDPIHYTITVSNVGGQEATATEVRDVLPATWSCAEVTSTSPAADSCAGGVVEWTGLTVPAGGSVVLDVYAVAPDSAAPGDSYQNHAGVRSYRGDSNSGPHTYFPRDNIDPTVTPNTDPADDTEVVSVGGGAITKTATSLVESGNNSAAQATIGEVVTFTVTATIPSGTTLYGSPAVTDAVNARYAIVGTPTFTLDTDGAGPTPPTAAAPATVSGSTVSVPLGPLDGDADDTTYVNPRGTGPDVVVLTIQVRVLDVASNRRNPSSSIPNTGTLSWQNSVGTSRSVSASRSMTVVEPNLGLAKTSDHAGTGVAGAGEIVNYTLTVGNSGARSSLAHEVRVTDTLPVQVEPLKAGDVPADDGDTLIGGGVWDATTRVITFPEIATIAVNGSSVLTYRVRVIDPVVVAGPMVNNARAVTSSLTGSATGERDSTSPNGGAGSGYLVTATHTLNAPAFTLGKTASPSTRTAGELVTYTLTVGVPAGVYAYDATILDTLPAGVRYHSAPITVTCQQGAGACSPAIGAQLIGTPGPTDSVLGFFLGDFAAATEARTVTIAFQGIVTTTSALGTQTNSARIYSNDVDRLGTPGTPPAPGGFDRPGPTATADVTVQRPRLTLDKLVNGAPAIRAVPGQVLHYTVAITNTGTSPAYDLTITDTPDARLTGYTPVSMPGVTPVDTDPSDGTLSWTYDGPLAVGATLTLAYDLTVPATLDETDEVVAGPEIVNTADVPSYFGVPEADRVLDPSVYNEYDDVPADQAQVELDLASLGDRVWFDADGDGVQETGEPGIPGATVTVLFAGADGTFGNADDESHTTTTDANGYYLVEHLPGGQYRVSVSGLPAGLTPSYDRDGIATPHVWTGALAQNGAPRDIDFGYLGTGSIGDRVWFDQDADGVQDPGEPGIPGRAVQVVWAGFDGDLATTADNVTYDTTTSASGAYTVGGLPAGSYRVEVLGMPAGYGVTGDPDGTLDGVSLTTLTGGQNRTDQDFGYAGTGSIGDLVWLDRNENGVFEPGGTPPEQGIAGAGLALDWHGVSGSVTDPVVGTFTTTTDASGLYLFDHLVPGAYTVRVTGGLPLAATNTFDRDGDLDSSAPVTIAIGEAVRDADFGYSSDSQLGERVWWDRNGDGVQDANEPGFPGIGITVRYFGPNGIEGDGDDLVFTTTTDSTGHWAIGDLPEGQYRVTVDPADLPAGFSPTFDADGTGTPHTSTTALGTGAELTQNFGYRGAFSLGDLVFLDRDADGVQDAGEPGLAGVTVQLTWGAFMLGAVTDASGLYGFEGLPAGTFTVTMLTASLPSTSLVPVSDLEGAPDDATATVVLAADRTDVDFGVRGDASLGDLVWHDRDADGVEDADESGIPGVTVTATWAGRDGVSGTADDVTISTVTDADGAYGFDHLPVGEWTVRVDLASLPSGFGDATFEEDGVLDARVVVTLAAGDAHDTTDFGYRGAGTIGDRIWLDLDGDGVQDAGEPGIVGQEVRVEWAGADGILGTADDETWTTTTGADGVWLVTGLPDGSFRVTVVGGITTLADQTGDPDATLDDQTTVALTPGSRTVEDADFGYRGPYAVGDTVWWDESEDGVVDPGELRLPGVTVEVTWAGLDGTLGTADDIVRTATTDASGEYLVEALPEGSYRVAVTAGIPAGLDPIADPDGVGAAADGVSEFDLPGTTVGTQDLTRDFGYAGSGSIGDRVWLDLNGDGVDDPGEPGIPGATATLAWFGPDGLEGTADDVAWTTTTDATGVYSFDGLPAGGFRVTLTGLPAGLAPTADPDGSGTPDTATLTLAAGATDLDQDFGYAGTASVGDTVWIDVDDDGVRAPLEPGLPGVVVTVRLAGADGVLGTADDILLTRTTDAAGMYLATGLPPGPIEVSYDPAALDPGYVPSFDRDGADAWTTQLALLPGDAIDDVDFAIVGDARLHGVVFDDRNGNGVRDPGEPGVPGVDITVVWDGPAGPVPVVVTTDPLGEWSLDALPPGTYVSEIDASTIPRGYRVDTERVVTRVLAAGGTGFVIMGITNRPLALTGHDPRTNLLIGLGFLVLGIGVLLVARARIRRRLT